MDAYNLAEMVFDDRQDAGRRLSDKLGGYRGEECIVLALPRGGVVVAAEVARSLGAPLDVAVVRKVGHPSNPEAAIGSVAEDGTRLLDERVEGVVPEAWLEAEIGKQIQEAKRRRREYTGDRPVPDLAGKTAILVDDGIATGYTMKAAVEWVRHRGAEKIVVAVPVAPPETIEKFKQLADDVIVVSAPPMLYAVGAHYSDFSQVTDEEVKALLDEMNAARAKG